MSVVVAALLLVAESVVVVAEWVVAAGPRLALGSVVLPAGSGVGWVVAAGLRLAAGSVVGSAPASVAAGEGSTLAVGEGLRGTGWP